MYPDEYTWIRNPMKVMIMHRRPDRPSIRKPGSILRSPAVIQLPTTSVSPCSALGSALKKASAATTHEAPMASAAIMNTVSRRILRPNSMRISDPMNGSSGMRRRLKVMVGVASALHQRRFVEVDGLPHAEETDEDGQPHRRLGGGERDDEEGEHVPRLGLGRIADGSREREQGQVAAVELELYPHEHDERVLAQEDARRPDEEQQEGEHEVV